MCKPLFGKSHRLVLDSAFCVVEGLHELALRGVYSSAVAKKRRYWPKHVRGKAVQDFMKDKPLAQLHVQRCRLENPEYQHLQYQINSVRHSRFTHILVSTYGNKVFIETKGVFVGAETTFNVQRNNVLKDYYKARHAVDDNNHLRQGTAGGLERAWGTRVLPTSTTFEE